MRYIISEASSPIAAFAGSLAVYWHGIIMAVALAVTVLIARSLLRRANRLDDRFWLTAFCALSIGVIFARAAYVFFNKLTFSADPSLVWALSRGGYSLAAGMLGGVLGVLIVNGRRSLPVLDAASVAGAAGIAIGRTAELCSCENIGPAIANERAHFFPVCIYNESTGTWRLVLSVYCAVLALILFAVLSCVYNRRAIRKKSDGDCMLLFMLLFGLTQCVLDAMRTDALFFNLLAFVKFTEIVALLSGMAAITVFAVRAYKAKGRAEKPQIACWIISAAGLAAGIYSEFRISAETMLKYYTIMISGVLAAIICGIILYNTAKRVRR